MDPNGRHKVEGKGTKDSRCKNEASRLVEKRSSPTRKVVVARRDNGKTICNGEFMRGEREAKVSLWESRDASTKGVSKIRGSLVGENRFDSSNGFRGSMEKNQGVVRILQNRARSVVNQGVADNRKERRLLQEAFEDIRDNDK